MPEVVFDCCCLSNFALSGSLIILKRLCGQSALITDFVSAEIMRGIQSGYKDLGKIREAVTEGWLKEITLNSKEEKSLYESLSVSLGLGEASSIAIANTRGLLFACDDKTARKEARLLNIKLTGTVGILKRAVKEKVINLKEGDRILSEMIAHGFYSSVSSLKDI
jgi:predicted nucleic acid-binding protein